jgi:hypothetical protein
MILASFAAVFRQSRGAAQEAHVDSSAACAAALAHGSSSGPAAAVAVASGSHPGQSPPATATWPRATRTHSSWIAGDALRNTTSIFIHKISNR